MPELDLDELERLHAAATPGPWRVESEVVRDSMGLFWPISSIEGAEDNVTENITTDDAAYIVTACNAVPHLIKALKDFVKEDVKRHFPEQEQRVRELEVENAALKVDLECLRQLEQTALER